MAKMTKAVEVVEFDEETGVFLIEVGEGKRRYAVQAPADEVTGELDLRSAVLQEAVVSAIGYNEAQRERSKGKADLALGLVGQTFNIEIDTVPERLATRITMERTSV